MAIICSACAAGNVHDKNYLRAIAIDGDVEKEMTLTFFVKEGDSVTAKGDDISSALKSAELKSGNQIVTGYTELVILDELNGRETLEFLLNVWKVSPSCIIVYCEDGDKILENNSSDALIGSVERAIVQEKIPKSDIITVLGKLLNDERRAEIASISVDGVIGTHIIE